MEKKDYHFSYDIYGSSDELSDADAELLEIARGVTTSAYAPYSQFRVGASARLVDGTIITGTNQENASFPVGICAERTLLSVAATLHPGVAIDTLAVSYDNENGASDRPISPCGICRQTILEYELRTGRKIRLLMGGKEGVVFAVKEASMLLPLAFTSEEMK